jgi:hypothetical protein
MTVPVSRQDRSFDHRRARTRRDDAEPRLDDLLADGTLQALMARDGVAREQLETLIDETRLKLGLGHTGTWSATRRFEAALFAECPAL